MSVLQEQIVQKISGLSEENQQFLLEMIERFMQPETAEKHRLSFIKNATVVYITLLYTNTVNYTIVNSLFSNLTDYFFCYGNTHKSPHLISIFPHHQFR